MSYSGDSRSTQMNHSQSEEVMRLTRWNAPLLPSRDLLNTRDDFGRLLEDFFGSPRSSHEFTSLFAPPADIHETPEAFVLKMDLPGVSPSDVKVRVTGDVLHVQGQRKEEKSDNGTTRHRIERVYGAFERRFKLSAPVRADQIKATYRDGVLEVLVPKAEEAKVREIEIQTA